MSEVVPCAVHHPLPHAAVLLLLAAVTGHGAPRQSPEPKIDPDLTEIRIEDLMNIEVSSPSRHEQRLAETATPIYVITEEDIRRSGVTTVADALRLAPGLHVGRIDSNKWAISARGFANRFSDRMLVLIDRRVVFSPAFNGVHWDVQDLLLEDIERIEVIRGPGATMWGSNAVNGVINIITKHARQTQGTLITAGASSTERGSGAVRHGAKLGTKAFYRTYVKYFDRGGFRREGNAYNPAWNAGRGGMRVDWDINQRDSLTISADVYEGLSKEMMLLGSEQQPDAYLQQGRTATSGGNVVTRWRRSLSDSSGFELGFFFDQSGRDDTAVWQKRNTLDVDFQHRSLHGSHDVIWGGGYRQTGDSTERRFTLWLNPPARQDVLVTSFLQDSITLVASKLRLIIGSKLEHNAYTGVEIQPGVRLLWMPSNDRAAWLSVARSVSTPSRADHNLVANLEVDSIGVVSLMGNPALGAEPNLTYEAGFRMQPDRKVSLDTALFYSRYSRVAIAEPAGLTGIGNPPLIAPRLTFQNFLRGESYGAEISTTWRVNNRVRLAGLSSFYVANASRSEASRNTQAELHAEHGFPLFHNQIRSYVDLPRSFELDAAFYHVSAMESRRVPGYLGMDIRFGYRPQEPLEFSAGMENIAGKRRLEHVSDDFIIPRTAIGRTAYGKITLRF